MGKKMKTQMMRREISINPEIINDDSREMIVSFASEEPYERWFGTEILEVDSLAMDLNRFQNGLGCLLYNHNRDAVIGSIKKVWIDGNKAYASVEFDTDEESEKIYQKVQKGTLKGVSVGYAVKEYTDLRDNEAMANGRIKGPAYVASKWEAYEISIVSVPADASVGVNRSLDDFNVVELKNLEGKEVAEKNVSAVEDVNKAVEAERERVGQITTLCRHFNVSPDEYIRSGKPLAEVQLDVLEQNKRAKAPSANIEVGAEDHEKYKAAATDALLIRSGIAVENPAQGASEMRGMRLRSIVEDVLEREGVTHVNRMDETELIRTALSGTGALPGILSNVANKSMLKAYEAAPTTFEAFTSIGSNVDFKEAKKYRLSEAGALLEIKENGEFEADEIEESDASTKVLTYGRAFSFTRQMLVNDDLSALTKVPALYAAQAKRGINRLVYQTLAGADYSSTNGNLAATPSALTLSGIDEGRVAMRTQKNIRGTEVLNITPKYLIVSTQNEFKARQLMTSVSDPNATHYGVVNPLMNSLEIVSDAELDLIDGKAWYLVADTSLFDAIEVTYLNGVQTPTIESQIAFDTLGIRYRIYIDYGVSVLDHKGLYKNAGK